MKPARIDFYTKVHKGLRAALFDFSRRAAATDFSEERALGALRSDLQSLLARLSTHARHEAAFIHPLITAKGAHAFDDDHLTLEAEQDALNAVLECIARSDARERRQQGQAFYRALNVFIARYLQHLAREEELMPLLWERCSDEELGAVMARFGASRPVAEALADIGWMLPALSAPEQAELIGGLSAALTRR